MSFLSKPDTLVHPEESLFLSPACRCCVFVHLVKASNGGVNRAVVVAICPKLGAVFCAVSGLPRAQQPSQLGAVTGRL